MKQENYIYVPGSGYLALDSKGKCFYQISRKNAITVSDHEEAIALIGLKTPPYVFVPVN